MEAHLEVRCLLDSSRDGQTQSSLTQTWHRYRARCCSLSILHSSFLRSRFLYIDTCNLVAAKIALSSIMEVVAGLVTIRLPSCEPSCAKS